MSAKTLFSRILFFGVFVSIGLALKSLNAQGHWNPAQFPAYLGDRGSGSPTSMFGTYCRKGELLLYPFYEYYINNDEVYSPEDFLYLDTEEYEGKYRASETLIFIGYGITEDIVVELEAAYIDASLERAEDDASGMPTKMSESGIGDVQMQLDWRFARETERHPEAFSYLEVVFPTQDKGALIGTTDWQVKCGVGCIKGFGFGTMSIRVSAEYDADTGETDVGEAAIEYLKRFSQDWRVYLGLEGTTDEVELINEIQWHFSKNAFLKVNNGFGVTPAAPDWAPEIGVMFSF